MWMSGTIGLYGTWIQEGALAAGLLNTTGSLKLMIARRGGRMCSAVRARSGMRSGSLAFSRPTIEGES
jgi:hypothetical protein